MFKSSSSAGGMTSAESAALTGATVGRGLPARSSTAGKSPPVLGRLARRGGLQLAGYERISFLEASIRRVNAVDTEKGKLMGEGKSGRGVKSRGQRSGL